MATRVVVENMTVATEKLADYVSRRLLYIRPYENSPVGISKVGGVLECSDEGDNRDHH
jgi:hypothetical protein